ncbi:RNA polymerase sigma-70 factor (ECF subfamily) [Stella humosa]|uniref:RNA polymerase sigma-70 factor (ECF subfamily) n=1 Tax=Stella humosa TaxID=94 RepID=A0A3N1M7X9_9PROT|nr:sigma-70 family RNA polymerase sigma factor [Stella humosa]ROP99807.1 RNA polymerase sigma-70 factor (ECF subfamily) [Stella humosa]BBK30965.1 RNA polymerase sigma factor [Stella humosa]
MSGRGAPGDGDPHGHPEDDELLARIAAGEQRALRRLVERHGRGIRLFAARFLGNAADGEDVAQDVFVAVWKHAGRFDPSRARATTWIYRIAANRCVDLRRWRRFRTFIGLDDVRELVPTDEPGGDDRIGARQDLALVRGGLARLPERQRMALLLRAVADLDVPAIAVAMGSTPGSVEQLLVRARRSLRARLAEMDGVAADGQRSVS